MHLAVAVILVTRHQAPGIVFNWLPFAKFRHVNAITLAPMGRVRVVGLAVEISGRGAMPRVPGLLRIVRRQLHDEADEHNTQQQFHRGSASRLRHDRQPPPLRDVIGQRLPDNFHVQGRQLLVDRADLPGQFRVDLPQQRRSRFE